MDYLEFGDYCSHKISKQILKVIDNKDNIVTCVDDQENILKYPADEVSIVYSRDTSKWMHPIKEEAEDDDWGFIDYSSAVKDEQEDYSLIYNDLAQRLMQLQMSASNVIFRRDNNEVFEMAFTLLYISQRIKNGYEN